MLLNIAEEFSQYPAGRIPEDGDFNGQRFREEFLVPRLHEAIQNKAILVVSLDGLKSCGSSFLEESFGGLVRKRRFSKKEVSKSLSIEAKNKSLERYKLAIERHIKNARPE